MDLSKLTMYHACLLHSRSERVLKAFVSHNLEKWSITRMEWLLLETVEKKSINWQGHTMGEIAANLDIRLSQVTALTAGVGQHKLISQTVSKKDKRTRYVKITPKGKELLEDIESDMRQAMREWLSGIPRNELAVYMQVVQRLGSRRD